MDPPYSGVTAKTLSNPLRSIQTQLLKPIAFSLIRVLGVKLSKMTPSRGYSSELAVALVVSISVFFGLPISTTHCIVSLTLPSSIATVLSQVAFCCCPPYVLTIDITCAVWCRDRGWYVRERHPWHKLEALCQDFHGLGVHRIHIGRLLGLLFRRRSVTWVALGGQSFSL